MQDTAINPAEIQMEIATAAISALFDEIFNKAKPLTDNQRKAALLAAYQWQDLRFKVRKGGR